MKNTKAQLEKLPESMKNLTYRELLAALKELPDKQLDMTVTIAIEDNHNGVEFLPIVENVIASDERIAEYTDGVLEEDQPVLVIDGILLKPD